MASSERKKNEIAQDDLDSKLAIACSSSTQDRELVISLIREGAKINGLVYYEPDDYRIPLFYAIEAFAPREFIVFLLDNGADPNILCGFHNEYTAFSYLLASNKIYNTEGGFQYINTIGELFLSLPGFDVNKVDTHGIPYTYDVWWNQLDPFLLIQLLNRRDLSLEILNRKCFFVNKDSNERTNTLLMQCCKVISEPKKRISDVPWAIAWKPFIDTVIPLLLSLGVNVDLYNSDKQTALDIILTNVESIYPHINDIPKYEDDIKRVIKLLQDKNASRYINISISTPKVRSGGPGLEPEGHMMGVGGEVRYGGRRHRKTNRKRVKRNRKKRKNTLKKTDLALDNFIKVK